MKIYLLALVLILAINSNAQKCQQIGSGIRFVMGGRQRVCGRCKDEIDAIKKRGTK
jgi:uncharacterized 2Fe-2S/4Fe-4S cluster protein (DUF4445 family)